MRIHKSIWFVLFLSLWELLARSGRFSPLVFPPLAAVFKALFHALASGELLQETGFSILLILEGLLVGAVLALLLGMASSLSPLLRSFTEALAALAHPLPGIALLPVIILWLGTGRASILFIIIHSVLWPMLLNVMTGFRAVPKVLAETGRNFGVRGARLFLEVYVPASLPYLLAGLRIAWARAWRALISAEMIFGAVGGKGGLGWYIFKQRVFMDTAGMFSALIVIILIGILVEEVIFERVEAATIRKWGMTDQ